MPAVRGVLVIMRAIVPVIVDTIIAISIVAFASVAISMLSVGATTDGDVVIA